MINKTYRLSIYNNDGTLYWREQSNSLQALQDWLTEEQTRPYWDATHRYEFEDITVGIDGEEVELEDLSDLSTT